MKNLYTADAYHFILAERSNSFKRIRRVGQEFPQIVDDFRGQFWLMFMELCITGRSEPETKKIVLLTSLKKFIVNTCPNMINE